VRLCERSIKPLLNKAASRQFTFLHTLLLYNTSGFLKQPYFAPDGITHLKPLLENNLIDPDK
jgi:hypothetical protein